MVVHKCEYCGKEFFYGHSVCPCTTDHIKCEKCDKLLGYYNLTNDEESNVTFRCLDCGVKVYPLDIAFHLF